ncbi:MAG: glycosyltransferase, partial [Luteibacter sp.]
MAREPLSVVVTTFNNADTIEACVASVLFADDILVLDSGSTDATRDIAA